MPGSEGPAATSAPGSPAIAAAADDREPVGGGRPWAWLRARFNDRPIRADRTAGLEREGGGRLDRLDLWMIAVLFVSVLTLRAWRLAEPSEMYFDEIYYARTAAEFLQDWRYGIPHDIYEWTHPNLAKYAMAVGIAALGDNRVNATSEIGGRVAAAAVEPRWGGPDGPRAGDRLWVAGGNQVRAYDLATRALIGTWPVVGASAITVDPSGHRAFIGTQAGQIAVIDTTLLDRLRARGGNARPESAAPALAWSSVEGPIAELLATADGGALVAIVPSASTGRSTVITFDVASTSERGRVNLTDIRQVVDDGTATVAIADASQVDFIDTSTGTGRATLRLDGPVGGLTATSGLDKDPLYVSYQSSDGPKLAVVTGGTGSDATAQESTFRLPGATAGKVYFDTATRNVHALGTTADGQPSVYVIAVVGNPRANAVFADAPLPFEPAAIVMDDNGQYPSSDRQQLLALSPSGTVASVEVGRNPWAWRLPGVLAGAIMAALLYVLARILFRRREVAVILAFLVVADGLLFAQSRIGTNDTYVGLWIIAAYTLFAALWVRPDGSRGSWAAYAVGMPVLGLTLGLALASKWVGAFALGGIGILVLSRSALGRLLLNIGLVGLTAALGYLAISTPGGANYTFFAILVALTLVSVVVTILRPIAWTREEERLATRGPIVIGGLLALGSLATWTASATYTFGPLTVTPLAIALLAVVAGLGVRTVFVAVGPWGFGPLAGRPDPGEPRARLEPPAPAPSGWLNLGSGFGIPAFFTLASLTILPIAVYVLSYVPWAFNGDNQIIAGATTGMGWPPGHTGQTLIDLTLQMYRYQNNLTAAHPASSPWWAWPLDLKPVWFYQGSFVGGTSASIYNAGNLVSWWLGIPAMAFIVWQAWARRSTALAAVAIAFAAQWLAWARIDRAAFQYGYYPSIPFVLIALAYFLAELWRGPSWRTWTLARLSAGVAVLLPVGLWLLDRPLCAVARVTEVNPGSGACPVLVSDVALAPWAIAITAVAGVGVLLLVREIFAASAPADDDRHLTATARTADGRVGRLGGSGVTRGLGRFGSATVFAVAAAIAFVVASAVLPPIAEVHLTNIPIEPIALVVAIALLPIAACVATARDPRRFVLGALVAIGGFFVLWYPNISALPLPSNLANAYQGLLPTYLYAFQFSVNQTPRDTGPSILSLPVVELGVAVLLVALVVAYRAWRWRFSVANRRGDRDEPRE